MNMSISKKTIVFGTIIHTHDILVYNCVKREYRDFKHYTYLNNNNKIYLRFCLPKDYQRSLTAKSRGGGKSTWSDFILLYGPEYNPFNHKFNHNRGPRNAITVDAARLVILVAPPPPDNTGGAAPDLSAFRGLAAPYAP